MEKKAVLKTILDKFNSITKSFRNTKDIMFSWPSLKKELWKKRYVTGRLDYELKQWETFRKKIKAELRAALPYVEKESDNTQQLWFAFSSSLSDLMENPLIENLEPAKRLVTNHYFQRFHDFDFKRIGILKLKLNPYLKNILKKLYDHYETLDHILENIMETEENIEGIFNALEYDFMSANFIGTFKELEKILNEEFLKHYPSYAPIRKLFQYPEN